MTHPNEDTSSPGTIGANGADDPWGERLPRRLGLFSAMAVLIGSTIGSGIFRTPSEVAAYVDTPSFFAAAWIVGALISLAGAMTLAELATLYPRSGGIYVYLREVFGPRWAFLFGWAELLILRPAAYGAIALISAEYFWAVVDPVGTSGSPEQFVAETSILSRSQLSAAALIVGVGAINYRGVLLGALVQNFSTVLKIGSLLALIGLGFFATADSSTEILSGFPLDPALQQSDGDFQAALSNAEIWSAFGLALVSVMWAYDGWSDVGFVSGEIKQPRRALPWAFVGGTGVVAILYLAMNWVYQASIPLESMGGRKLIASDVAQIFLGPDGAIWVSLAVALSTFGCLNGAMMTGPRVFFAMGEDGLLPRWLGKIHPKYQSPSRSILLSIALGVVFVCFRNFGELADQFVIGIWPFYALSVAAVLILRRRESSMGGSPESSAESKTTGEQGIYRVWGYPFVPLFFLAATAFLLINYAIRQPVLFAINMGVLGLGLFVFGWIQKPKTN